MAVLGTTLSKLKVLSGPTAGPTRYFEDARHEDPENADYAVTLIKTLFDVEEIGASLSEGERKALRQRLAKPTLNKLKTWMAEKAQLSLPKSALTEAITY